MAKRRRSGQPVRPRSVWRKITVGVIILIVLASGTAWLTTQSTQSETVTQSTGMPTAGLTASLTATPEPSPAQLDTTAASNSSTLTVELAAPTPSPTLNSSGSTPLYSYEIIKTYPHDPAAFTQGLILENGILYEGTGLRGQSSLRKVELETGNVTQMIALPDQFFGEGLTLFGDNLIQLTWQSNVGFVYDRESFELLREFNYPTEGWGLTHDTQYLIMSDGTSNLYFLDPETFAEIKRIEVHDQGSPIKLLNELEYVQGEIFANVWQTTRIARISPETGQVLGWIELAGILAPQDLTQRVDVLNGIAYDAANDRLFVTGKWWPKLFEIKLTPLE